MMKETQEEQLFQKAYQLQKGHDFSGAITTYKELLRINPNHTNALHFMGLAHASMSEFEQALDCLISASKLEPKNPSIQNNLGNLYQKKSLLINAIEHYHKALIIASDYAQAHNNLAAIYTKQGQTNKALKHYKDAIHNQPDFTDAHFNLGLLLLKIQQLDAAQKQFHNVITLNPNHLDAWFYLGVLYLNGDVLEKAEEAFKNVLAIYDEHAESLTNLGVIALKKEQGQIAIDYFTRALAIDNTHVEARNNLAATFIHNDRYENALMHYDVLLQNEPDNIEYLYNSGVAEMALGHLQKAQAHFETILANNPKHFATLNNLAAIYMRLEDKKTAVEFLQQALLVEPNNASTQYMLDALTGNQTPSRASADYISQLFDNYSLYYEQHMTKTLQYKLPEFIAQKLHQLHLIKIGTTIDLGCGTGLSGSVLRELSQILIGVDLSTKMLAIAKEKNIYDKLYHEDAINFIKNYDRSMDLVVAADIVPYLGDLEPLISSISKKLSAKGHVIFSCEISKEKDWLLQSTARFCHHPDYIKTLCDKHHLTIVQKEKITSRQQSGQDLSVMIFILKNNS